MHALNSPVVTSPGAQKEKTLGARSRHQEGSSKKKKQTKTHKKPHKKQTTPPPQKNQPKQNTQAIAFTVANPVSCQMHKNSQTYTSLEYNYFEIDSLVSIASEKQFAYQSDNMIRLEQQLKDLLTQHQDETGGYRSSSVK